MPQSGSLYLFIRCVYLGICSFIHSFIYLFIHLLSHLYIITIIIISVNGKESEQSKPRTCLFDSKKRLFCWLAGCLTSQQQASVSQGRICSDNFTCCHTEIEVADPTFYLTQSQYTDTGPTSPSADPISPGAWQGSHWNANFEVTGMTRPRKNPVASGIRTRDLPLSRRTP